MKLQVHDLSPLAVRLAAERKRQGLSRTQAAAVCNVSTSFIRDAESTPERCSLGKLLLLVQGLGRTMEVAGWPAGPKPYDGAWAPHWYNAVHASTGFDEPEGDLPALSPEFQRLCDQALPHYKRLERLKL